MTELAEQQTLCQKCHIAGHVRGWMCNRCARDLGIKRHYLMRRYTLVHDLYDEVELKEGPPKVSGAEEGPWLVDGQQDSISHLFWDEVEKPCLNVPARTLTEVATDLAEWEGTRPLSKERIRGIIIQALTKLRTRSTWAKVQRA